MHYLVLCAGATTIVQVMDKKYHALLIVAVPLLLAGGHCALALPGAAPMFSELGIGWKYVGASISMALSIGLVWALSKVYCDSPGRLNQAVAA